MGNVAWAVFSQNFSAIYNGADYKSTSLQAMALQKMDGNWKISCFVDANVPNRHHLLLRHLLKKARRVNKMTYSAGSKTHGCMGLFFQERLRNFSFLPNTV